MEVKSITIVRTSGADKVFLHTDLEEACYPYNAALCVEFNAAKGSGQQYCIENFPGVQIKVVP